MVAQLFDTARLRRRRARVAGEVFAAHDFLLNEAAQRVADTLDYLARPFPVMVELGCHGDRLARLVAERAGTEHYIACDAVAQMLPPSSERIHAVQADAELLPFAPQSVDAVLSIGALHWANDLTGCLAQVERVLKPDGLFMAIFLGCDTLRELRTVLAETDIARFGGMAARVAPFPELRDAGGLLQRAGFALPVAESDKVEVSYAHLFDLMKDLRGMGATNMLREQRQSFTSRGFFADAAARYHAVYADEEGRIPATFEFIMLTAWKQADTQQKPAKRGSGMVPLGEALR